MEIKENCNFMNNFNKNDNSKPLTEEEHIEESRHELLNYNKSRHLELLNKKNKTKKDHLKLAASNAILESQLNWEIRDQYLMLLTDYINGKMSIVNFLREFNKLYDAINESSNLLLSKRIFLSPDEKSGDFSYLVMRIADCSEIYSNEPEDSWEMDGFEFRSTMKQIYFNLKKLLNDEPYDLNV